MIFVHTVPVQAITFVPRPTATYQALDLDVPAAWLGALGAGLAFSALLSIDKGEK